MLKASGDQILAPFRHLQDYMLKLKLGLHSDDHSSSLRSAVTSCMRDLYHYVRVAGLHVLECIMDTAFSAVRNEQLEEVSYVSLFSTLKCIYHFLKVLFEKICHFLTVYNGILDFCCGGSLIIFCWFQCLFCMHRLFILCLS